MRMTIHLIREKALKSSFRLRARKPSLLRKKTLSPITNLFFTKLSAIPLLPAKRERVLLLFKKVSSRELSAYFRSSTRDLIFMTV